MDKSIFAAMPALTPTLGFASMIGLGLFSLALSYGVKTTAGPEHARFHHRRS